MNQTLSKLGKYALNAAIIILLVFTLDGAWMWLGIGSFLLTLSIIAGIKLWHGRQTFKVILDMAGALGAQHKEEARQKNGVGTGTVCEIQREEEDRLNGDKAQPEGAEDDSAQQTDTRASKR